MPKHVPRRVCPSPGIDPRELEPEREMKRPTRRKPGSPIPRSAGIPAAPPRNAGRAKGASLEPWLHSPCEGKAPSEAWLLDRLRKLDEAPSDPRLDVERITRLTALARLSRISDRLECAWWYAVRAAALGETFPSEMARQDALAELELVAERLELHGVCVECKEVLAASLGGTCPAPQDNVPRQIAVEFITGSFLFGKYVPELRAMLAHCEKTLGKQHPETLLAKRGLARALNHQPNPEALRLMREVWKHVLPHLPTGSREQTELHEDMCSLLRWNKLHEEAIAICRKWIEEIERMEGPMSRRLLEPYIELQKAYAKLGLKRERERARRMEVKIRDYKGPLPEPVRLGPGEYPPWETGAIADSPFGRAPEPGHADSRFREVPELAGIPDATDISRELALRPVFLIFVFTGGHARVAQLLHYPKEHEYRGIARAPGILVPVHDRQALARVIDRAREVSSLMLDGPIRPPKYRPYEVMGIGAREYDSIPHFRVWLDRSMKGALDLWIPGMGCKQLKIEPGACPSSAGMLEWLFQTVAEMGCLERILDPVEEDSVVTRDAARARPYPSLRKPSGTPPPKPGKTFADRLWNAGYFAYLAAREAKSEWQSLAEGGDNTLVLPRAGRVYATDANTLAGHGMRDLYQDCWDFLALQKARPPMLSVLAPPPKADAPDTVAWALSVLNRQLERAGSPERAYSVNQGRELAVHFLTPALYRMIKAHPAYDPDRHPRPPYSRA